VPCRKFSKKIVLGADIVLPLHSRRLLACAQVVQCNPDRTPTEAIGVSDLLEDRRSLCLESSYQCLQPDDNKRTAFLLTEIFLEINGCPLNGELPDIDVSVVEQIAVGQANHGEIVTWLLEHTGSKSKEY
jgi:hypothetical protein